MRQEWGERDDDPRRLPLSERIALIVCLAFALLMLATLLVGLLRLLR